MAVADEFNMKVRTVPSLSRYHHHFPCSLQPYAVLQLTVRYRAMILICRTGARGQDSLEEHALL